MLASEDRGGSGYAPAGDCAREEARRDWELFDLPISLEEALERAFALAEGDVREHHKPSSGSNRKMAHFRLLGRLFMMVGYKDDPGDWVRVDTLAPVEPDLTKGQG